MKQKILNRILSISLLLSLSIPFTINSLHFIIFEHHSHNHFSSDGLSIYQNKDTHSLCLWDFATEEIIDNSILITNCDFIYSIEKAIIVQNYILININKLSLRAPPF